MVSLVAFMRYDVKEGSWCL